ncbi:hypothetical protein DQ384_04545 [Sphaerisporangium album]|uniref:Uncharacterized protein n=1 Tax=Sphaerisporangium album TaxID=509200 RepID=A0A367FS72_9ACTN|nr:hypothetical protein [Sphaerisporangium album]RCG32749.1 hypothetical protein DQ384_04545 [Sphaerisporangium album]
MVGLAVTPLRLDAGFDVHLRWVEMTLTYGGLIEGVPRQRMNDEMFIGRTMERTRRKWTQYPSISSHRLEPSRTISNASIGAAPAPTRMALWSSCRP